MSFSLPKHASSENDDFDDYEDDEAYYFDSPQQIPQFQVARNARKLSGGNLKRPSSPTSHASSSKKKRRANATRPVTNKKQLYRSYRRIYNKFYEVDLVAYNNATWTYEIIMRDYMVKEAFGTVTRRDLQGTGSAMLQEEQHEKEWLDVAKEEDETQEEQPPSAIAQRRPMLTMPPLITTVHRREAPQVILSESPINFNATLPFVNGEDISPKVLHLEPDVVPSPVAEIPKASKDHVPSRQWNVFLDEATIPFDLLHEALIQNKHEVRMGFLLEDQDVPCDFDDLGMYCEDGSISYDPILSPLANHPLSDSLNINRPQSAADTGTPNEQHDTPVSPHSRLNPHEKYLIRDTPLPPHLQPKLIIYFKPKVKKEKKTAAPKRKRRKHQLQTKSSSSTIDTHQASNQPTKDVVSTLSEYWIELRTKLPPSTMEWQAHSPLILGIPNDPLHPAQVHVSSDSRNLVSLSVSKSHTLYAPNQSWEDGLHFFTVRIDSQDPAAHPVAVGVQDKTGGVHSISTETGFKQGSKRYMYQRSDYITVVANMQRKGGARVYFLVNGIPLSSRMKPKKPVQPWLELSAKSQVTVIHDDHVPLEHVMREYHPDEETAEWMLDSMHEMGNARRCCVM